MGGGERPHPRILQSRFLLIYMPSPLQQSGCPAPLLSGQSYCPKGRRNVSFRRWKKLQYLLSTHKHLARLPISFTEGKINCVPLASHIPGCLPEQCQVKGKLSFLLQGTNDQPCDTEGSLFCGKGSWLREKTFGIHFSSLW